MDRTGGIYSTMHLGNARSAPLGERCCASLGRNDYRAEFGRAISPLCRKRFENWWFWIAADVICIPLYVSRQLPLTAVLYAVFLAMCLVGVREWGRAVWKKGAGEQ